jgi:hypothetical protein
MNWNYMLDGKQAYVKQLPDWPDEQPFDIYSYMGGYVHSSLTNQIIYQWLNK